MSRQVGLSVVLAGLICVSAAVGASKLVFVNTRGIANSHRMGVLLRQKYVNTGFLNENLITKEIYFRSVKVPRCLMTAAIVGAAMYEVQQNYLHVPVYTEETTENLLNYDVSACQREIELVRERCRGYEGPHQFKNWPLYEEFVYKCLNLSNPILEKYAFNLMEAYINQYKNGVELPEDLQKEWNAVMSDYTKVGHFITGTGPFHNPRLMRVKFGTLNAAILQNVQRAWNCYKNATNCRNKDLKFVAYSSQDWILTGVLDSLNILNATIPIGTYPEYNSMLLVELHDVDDQPAVKVLFKQKEVVSDPSELIDVTQHVNNCPTDKEFCPLQKFMRCCDDYLELVPGSSCKPLQPENFFDHNGMERVVRAKRYAGHE